MRTTLLALLLAATACKSDEAPTVAASASTAVAGTVVDVKGTVTVAGKPLAKGDTVTADTTIDTGAESSVTILLAHNDVKLELGANKHVRVNESIAWKAPKRVEPGAGPDEATMSAGRPAERNAAETAITAVESKEATQDKDAPPGAAARGEPTPDPVAVASPPKPTTKETAKTETRRETESDKKDDFEGGGGGLGLSGVGKGGGGAGDGIGLGGVGTIGRGGGTGQGTGYGAGNGGIGGGTNRSKPPTISPGKPQITGSLPPDIIRRIVRSNTTRVKVCYEQGLKKKPGLAGTLNVKFTIDKDGKVVSAADAGNSTLGDADVLSCVVKVFLEMGFPKPEKGGIVTVTYPFVLSPGQ